MSRIRRHTELDVYKNALDASMEIFRLTKTYPAEEKYSLVDQIRRSSRSVCANIAEAWRKRRYPAHFVSKLSDAEGEAAETLVWLDFSLLCEYMDDQDYDRLVDRYDKILGQLVNMSIHPEHWTIR